MDSVSETLKQSEPCSPSSPASQDPLQRLHVANIQFNNLDIIANQETIVELKFDKTFKRRLNYGPSLSESTSTLVLKVTFELPIFVIRLQNEINQALIEISFRDFNVNFEKNNQYETNFQISLRSILMEDLLCPVEIMVTSSSPDSLIGGSNVFLSHSCPNFADVSRFNYEQGSSLPNNFDDRFLFFNQKYRNIQQSTIYPGTPPPSPQPKPRQDNLVRYSLLLQHFCHNTMDFDNPVRWILIV